MDVCTCVYVFTFIYYAFVGECISSIFTLLREYDVDIISFRYLPRLRRLITDLFIGSSLGGARRKRLLLRLHGRSGSTRRCARRTMRRDHLFTIFILLQHVLRLQFRSSEISGRLFFWRYYWLIRWYRGWHAARDRRLFRGQDTTTTTSTSGDGSGCLNSGAGGRT